MPRSGVFEAVDVPQPAPIAMVSNLRVSFPTRDGPLEAVRGVSLDIQPGEIVALVGESGSGKSVLGLSILGLLAAEARPDVSGDVRIAGVDMLRDSKRRTRMVRRHLLGAVFQDPLTSLNPTMKIASQLLERGGNVSRAQRLLGEAGVPQPANRLRQFPFQLSGGLRQRVMIGMSMGGRGMLPEGPRDVPIHIADDGGAPKLIVADEPTTALDASVQAQVLILFDRLRREHGCAILLITHDLGVAASIADRIAVIYAGRLCEVGTAKDVLLHPAHPYTRALLRARLSISGPDDAEPIPGEFPNAFRLPTGCPFSPRCSRAHPECDARPPDLGKAPVGHDGAVACLFPYETTKDEPAACVSVRRRSAPKPEGDDVPALELVGVSKAFGIGGRGPRQHLKLQAVRNVNLVVPAGGAVALVGESGCGKTTTLRMAVGLTDPDSGFVKWGSGLQPQLIFQDCGSSLTPWMPIAAQIEERLRYRKVLRRQRHGRALELLALVGLDARAARSKPQELSGGQRQRAAIARALACDPKVLVCDEPVSALDASLAVRVLTLLDSLRRELGLALLVVTHDLAAARRLVDRVAVMYLGNIVEEAPTEEIFRNPKHPYTQGLLAACPTTEPGRLAPTLGGEPPNPTEASAGCVFASRCPMVEELCRVVAPVLRPLQSDVHVSCHLVEPRVTIDLQRRAPTP